MAKKEISGYVKLQINGGQANPAPPVGPALGQRGINIMALNCIIIAARIARINLDITNSCTFINRFF